MIVNTDLNLSYPFLHFIEDVLKRASLPPYRWNQALHFFGFHQGTTPPRREGSCRAMGIPHQSVARNDTSG